MMPAVDDADVLIPMAGVPACRRHRPAEPCASDDAVRGDGGVATRLAPRMIISIGRRSAWQSDDGQGASASKHFDIARLYDD